MSTLWTRSEQDVVLDTLLACTSEAQFKRTCDHLADRLGKGSRQQQGTGKRDGRLVERFLWGLATRVREYEPGAAFKRVQRSGEFTWAEKKVVQWATSSKTKADRKKPDVVYLQALLCRSYGSTVELVNRHGKARGRKGFNLGSKA